MAELLDKSIAVATGIQHAENETRNMTDHQIYNLLAGLAVVLILFGGLGVYVITKAGKDAVNQARLAEFYRLRPLRKRSQLKSQSVISITP